jgi:hypothetical protein
VRCLAYARTGMTTKDSTANTMPAGEVRAIDELRELRMSLRYGGAEDLDRRYPAISTGGG